MSSMILVEMIDASLSTEISTTRSLVQNLAHVVGTPSPDIATLGDGGMPSSPYTNNVVEEEEVTSEGGTEK